MEARTPRDRRSLPLRLPRWRAHRLRVVIKRQLLLSTLLLVVTSTVAINNGMARTPPMGE